MKVTSISTKYWPPSTSWRLCQRLHMTIENNFKTINWFTKIVFDRCENSLECSNRVTHKYRLWQPAIVRYRTREKASCFCLVWKGKKTKNKTKNEQCIFCDCLKSGFSLSFLSNRYFSVGNFIHHDKMSIFTSVFETAPVQAL